MASDRPDLTPPTSIERLRRKAERVEMFSTLEVNMLFAEIASLREEVRILTKGQAAETVEALSGGLMAAEEEIARLTAALAQRDEECARLRMAGGLLAEEVERALHHTDKGHRNLRLRLADFRTAERDAALSQQEAGNGQ